MENPGERLKHARKTAGYKSAAAAARALEIPEVTYRSHENGSRGIDGPTAKAYGEFFGASWSWLLTGVGDSGLSTEIPPKNVVIPKKSTPDDSEISQDKSREVQGEQPRGVPEMHDDVLVEILSRRDTDQLADLFDRVQHERARKAASKAKHKRPPPGRRTF
jgi:hypothetical protein